MSAQPLGKAAMSDVTIVIKGAGEIASGIAHRLFTAGMTRICMLELENPLCVRRSVAFCEALFREKVEIEGVAATRARNCAALFEGWSRGEIGVIVDPSWSIIAELKPDVVVDAILAKKNLGTRKDEAPVVIGVGPGFSAPDEVHAAVETSRGPGMGRAIYRGRTEPGTGIPAKRAGYSWARVIRAPHAGLVRLVKSIGDPVQPGDTVLYVDATPVRAAIGGIMRGLIRESYVQKHEKLGDIDPGGDPACCREMSDKARAAGSGVLEAITHLLEVKDVRS